MRIGIYVTAEPFWGGVYQYTFNLINALKKHDNSNTYFIFIASQDRSFDSFAGNGWEVIHLLRGQSKASSYFAKLAARAFSLIKEQLMQTRASILKDFPLAVTINRLVKKKVYDNTILAAMKAYVAEKAIDLMIYPTHNNEAIEVGIPFIIAVHDIQHKLQPEFPEVSADGEYEARERFFSTVPLMAVAVLVDSEVGKEDITQLYHVASERVEIMPFIPPHYLFEEISPEAIDSVKVKYNLPEKYLFYPAQFWPHKNHERIVRALHHLKQTRGLQIHLVLVGSTRCKFSTFNRVMAVAKELAVNDQIRYLGYVPASDMLPLYSGALALVMPTFFGPTNIPILEAFALKCPVITSDIRGIREQVGKAGLLIDPRNVEQLAEAIFKVSTDENTRIRLIDEGLKAIARWTEADFALKLIDIINRQSNIISKS
ncbi:MAG: glycosyltransferase family 1 protein [Actinomycetota bacterium]|nr:glycosyltransferase family 1 protein [Actinomycetota bacterium]